MGRVAVILASVLMLACEDPIDIEIPNVIERVVVEGIISNEPSSSQVLLSLTNRFDDTSSNPTISDAQVSVIDDQNNTVVFLESASGKYVPTSSWQPTIGSSYKCLITLPDGKKIESTLEKLMPIPKIDSLYAERKLPILILAGIEQFEYYLNATITDDARENNFFRWQLKRNQQKLENPEDLVLFSDRFVNGEIFNYRLSRIIFVPGDSVTIKQSSLSTNAYNYYNLLFQQATKLGQASGTAPALLKGNLINPDDNSELVLGYFRASAYTQKAFLFN
jgi:hypothetical protein